MTDGVEDDPIAALVAEARAMLRAGEPQQAAEAIDPLLALYPLEPDGNALGGVISLMLGRVSEAAQRLAIADQARGGGDAGVTTYLAVAMAALDLGVRAEQAIAGLQSPGIAELFLQCADGLERAGRRREAVNVCRFMGASLGDDPWLRQPANTFTLGLKQIALDDLDGAEALAGSGLAARQARGHRLGLEAIIAVKRSLADLAKARIAELRAVDPDLAKSPALQPWVERMASMTVEATPVAAVEGACDLLFGNLTFSGSSALVPILEEVLARRGILIPAYGPESTARHLADPPPSPHFHWTHDDPERFEPLIRSGRLKAVYLHRDPRDVAISMAEHEAQQGTIHQSRIPDLLRDLPQSSFVEQIRAACRWVRLAESLPIKIIRFDDMKRDTVGMVLDILAFYGVSVDDTLIAEVRRLYDGKYSFEAITNRPRGSVGPMVRNRFMLRRGVSGEWYDRFDDEIMAAWTTHLGAEIEALGYGSRLVLREFKRLRELERAGGSHS